MIFKPGTGFVSSNYVEDKKKLNPFRVHFMRLFNPHVGSLCSPTWGFQKHNSYRVAKMENETHITNTRLSRAQLVPSCKYGKRNTYYKYKTFKSTIHTELLSHLSPVILPHGHYDETIGWRSLRYLRQIAWQDEASDEVI